MQLVCAVVLGLLAHGQLHGQDWETQSAGDLQYEIPTPYERVEGPFGQSLMHHGGEIFITANALVDTTLNINAEAKEKTRYYGQTVATAFRRLKGQLVVAKDTTMLERHMYFATLQVKKRDGVILHYDLLQYVTNGTLYGFSCEYDPAVKKSVKMRDRYFDSIRAEGTPAKKRAYSLPIIGLGVVVLLVILAIVMRRLRKK